MLSCTVGRLWRSTGEPPCAGAAPTELQLGVTDVRFDALDQLRRHFPDAVFLGVLSRFLEYLLFRLTPYDVLTPARRVYLRIPGSLP